MQEVNNIDSINVSELSCRPRTVTNVGLDYLINKDFKKGRASFYRYELSKPPSAWSGRDFDFYEEKCPECPPKDGAVDKRVKCLKTSPVVTEGFSRKLFVVLYPLIGKM